MSKDILESPFFKTNGGNMNPVVVSPSDVPLTPLDKFPRFISTKETGDKVFLVENGKAHWVINPEALAAVKGTFSLVRQVTKQDYKQLDIKVENITVDNAGKYITEEPKVEFKTYEDSTPPILENIKVQTVPGIEPEKGFTSIIIPAYLMNYQLFHQTGHCIGSIREHTDKLKTPYEIILVLNGKTGIGFNKPEDTMTDKVIEIQDNVGFAAAVNKGIRVARGEYISIISNDVLVFDHWLEDFQYDLNKIDESGKTNELVMACPMYGMPYARATEADHFRQLALDGHPITVGYERDFSCVATRKKLFDEIGLMDEDFFLYKEDLDLFNRMDKAGKKYGLTRSVNTWHCIGMTTVNQSPEEQKSEQSHKHYEEKYGQPTV